jgi:hypothetical protein
MSMVSDALASKENLMTMTRICLATAALLTLAISGIASAPRTALAEARPVTAQPMSSPAGADGVEATAQEGVAVAWLRNAPRPNNVCLPPSSCCVWKMPHVCAQCC